MAQGGDRKTAVLADAERPLVLVGPPRAVRGEFQVQNSTDRKIVVRQPRLRAAAVAEKRGKAAKAAAAAALPQPNVSLRRIIVRPGQARPVPVMLNLDPRTPPGTYHAELDVDGEQRSVVVHVTEDVALTMTPDHLVLPNRPGETLTKQVVFTNDGNVDVSVQALGTVVLDEELAHCRALRGALADVGDTMKSLDDFAVALGKRYHAIYETLVLRVKNDAVVVAPGDTKALDLTITIPEKLERRSRYTGYAAISTATLTFTIVPD